MKIVVLVKQVPDSGAERHLRAEDSTVDRASATNVINEMDEYAIEEALRVREAVGGEVVVLSMGPARAAEALRKALQMGPDSGVHVVDDALPGSDAVSTSRVLAAAVGRLAPDLVLCGAEATDARGQVMGHMLAERLGWAALTGARKLTVEASAQLASGASGSVGLTIERQTEDGYEVVAASVPAVVSVWDTINEPRYPSFKGIMEAKKKQILAWSLADVGIDPVVVGVAGAGSAVVGFAKRPPRSGGAKLADDGAGGARLVEFLVAEKFV